MADALPEVAEIDVNPLAVTIDSTVPLDVRMRPAPAAG
jgi:hypothetical protein